MSGTRSPSPRARATDAAAGAALVIATHGIDEAPGIAAVHAREIAARGIFRTVAAACLRGTPSIEEVIGALAPGPVRVVPLLMAEGYILAWLRARLAPLGREHPIEICQTIGTRPEIAALVTELAETRCRERGWQRKRTSLVLAGHGTGRYITSGDTAFAQASRIRQEGNFADVFCAFLEQEPFLSDVIARITGPVIVAGFFVDAGPHGHDDVQAVLAPFGERAAYLGTLGGHPRISDLIVEAASNCSPVTPG